MRLFVALCALGALALAGCSGTGLTGQNAFGSAPAKPKTILVGDFVFASDVTAIDRGFTARLSKKVGDIPFHIRKQRTIERVVGLFRLTFRDPGLVVEDVRGEPVYLILSMAPDKTIRMKPQNLVTGLPIRHLEGAT